MPNEASRSVDPTEAIPIDLPSYVDHRAQQHSRHIINGIPDYSFSLDRQLRRQLAALAPMRWALRRLAHSLEPIYQQIYLMEGIAVGPGQYPEIHAMGEHCSKRLGIGVPQIFILSNPIANAMTLCSDDRKPSIVITTSLVQGLSEIELLAIIGHECGHIHNLHGAYHVLAELLTNPLASAIVTAARLAGVAGGLLHSLAGLLEASIALFLARWSRCAEITCDRAGTICAGEPTDMMRALIKLQTGGAELLKDINIEAYIRQVDAVKSTPLRLRELWRSHPLTHKRVQAVRLFGVSDVLRSWCPDHSAERPARPLAEIDAECEPLIRVWAAHPRSASRKDDTDG